MKLKLATLFVLMLTLNVCIAQTKTDVITNSSVVSLVKAGLPASVIVTTIENANAKFDVSANALIALKSKGVPDDVISAMVNKKTGVAPAITNNPVSRPATVGEKNIGKLPPGIYYAEEGTGKQTELEASVFSQSKVGSGILSGLTYGIAKTKAKAVLSGTQANLQISSHNPVFYFVFPANGGGSLGNEAGNSAGWYSNATSPNEFLLVKFKVVNTSRNKGREVVTGSFGTYSGFSGGIDDANKVAYRFTKLSPGVYKVYFEAPVTEGEYAFLFAGTAATAMGGTTSQKAYDFSVLK